MAFGCRDLAASNGSRHASGTDLSGRDHFGGPSLSPRLSRASRKHCREHRPTSMQPARTIHSYPDTTGRGRPASIRVPLSIALLSAGFAEPQPVARVRADRGAGAADRGRFARRHQAARAGTRSRARPAKERGRSAGEAQGRDRGDRPGPQQAQPAADRHRGAGARRRDQDRRRRSAAAPARLPRTADPRLARFAPLRDRRGAGRPATRRTAHAAGLAGAGRKTRCNRCAPPCCSARWCPNCARAPRS